MAITRFQDLPSTSTPINSANLNGNFDELGAKVGTSVDNTYKTNIVIGKNLLNKDIFYNSYLNNGVVTNSPQSALFNYIGVIPNTTYTFSSSSSIRYLAIYEFNDTKTYLTMKLGENVSNYSFTTGNNTKYIRIDINKDASVVMTQSVINELTPQLEKNTSATTYEAYISPSIVVEEQEIYNKDNLETYSTTEQRIGTWLGKPLYRRVFEIPQTSINSSDVTVINFNLADTNYVTKIEGMIGVTTSNTYYPIFGSPNRANVGYQVRRVSSAIQIIVDQTMSAESSIKGGQMIVEYTKTTD